MCLSWCFSCCRPIWSTWVMKRAFKKGLLLWQIYAGIPAKQSGSVSWRIPSLRNDKGVIFFPNFAVNTIFTNNSKRWRGWGRRPTGRCGWHEMPFWSSKDFKETWGRVTHGHPPKKSYYPKKCSIIPLSHLIKIWWTAATMRLTLIWQQDNHGRQMASNSITGVGHVMSDSLLTVTGSARCWQTHIDPGHTECWCIIV